VIVLLFVEFIILTVQDNWNVHNYFCFHTLIWAPHIRYRFQIIIGNVWPLWRRLKYSLWKLISVRTLASGSRISFNKITVIIQWTSVGFQTSTLSSSKECGLMILMFCISMWTTIIANILYQTINSTTVLV